MQNNPRNISLELDLFLAQLLSSHDILNEDNLYENLSQEIKNDENFSCIQNSEDIPNFLKNTLMQEIKSSNQYKEFINLNQSPFENKRKLLHELVISTLNENKIPDKNEVFIEVLDIILNKNILEILNYEKLASKKQKTIISFFEKSDLYKEYIDLRPKEALSSLKNPILLNDEEKKADSNESINDKKPIESLQVVEKEASPWKIGKLEKENIIQIIKLFIDKQNNSLVEKFLISKEELNKFNSLFIFPETTNRYITKNDQLEGFIINFDLLDKLKLNILGIVGRPENIKAFFLSNKILGEKEYELLEATFNEGGIGVYLISIDHQIKISDKIFSCLLVLWSPHLEDYEKVTSKRAYCRFFRYFTQLSNYNIICLSQPDLDLINLGSKQETNRFKKYKTVNEEVEKEKCEMFEGSMIPISLKEEDLKLCCLGENSGFFYKTFSQSLKKKKKENRVLYENKVKDFFIQKAEKFILDFSSIEEDKLEIIFIKLAENKSYEILQEFQMIKNSIEESYNEQIEEETTKQINTTVMILTLQIMREKYPMEYKALMKMMEKEKAINIDITAINFAMNYQNGKKKKKKFEIK